jgi:hypothetical protein
LWCGTMEIGGGPEAAQCPPHAYAAWRAACSTNICFQTF